MKNIDFRKHILPHIVAVVAFLVICIMLYHPLVFESKTINQNDINQGAGASSEIMHYRQETGKQALWTNSMFSGMPTYMISLHWIGSDFLNKLQQVVTMFLPGIIRENFMAFVTFYILLLAFGVRPYLALAGAIGFGLNTFYVVSIEAGHMWKVRAIAYMPLVLAGIHLVFKRKFWLGLIITAFALALEINANHLQITYYLLILVAIYGITQFVFAVKQNELPDFLKKTGILAVGALLAVSINIGRIWTTLEYGPYSIRGKSELTKNVENTSSGLDRDYAFSWSSGKWESMTMLVPDLYGGASGKAEIKNSELANTLRRNNVPQNQIEQYVAGTLGYWGDQPGTAGPVYIGAIICFLFVLGFFMLEPKQKWWLVLAIVFSIILSWGKNFSDFNYFIFDHLPGYNKFRAVTMTVVIALLCIPLMGFLSLEKLIKEGLTKQNLKYLLYAAGITGGIALLIALFATPPRLDVPQGSQIPDWFTNAVYDDRKSIIRADAFRSIFFIAAALAIIYFYLKGKISNWLTFSLMALLIAIDIGFVDTRYLNENSFIKKGHNDFFTETEADKVINQDKSLDYRVLNLQNPFNEARTSNFHFSIGGYHGAKIRRYQDLIEGYLSPEMQQIIKDKGITRDNSKIISMLNTKYLLAGTQKNAVLRNPYALGNAWFVHDIKAVNSPDEEYQSLGEINPATTAVMDQSKFKVPGITADSTAEIRLIKYNTNQLTYESHNQKDGLAVFSEIYYPVGWKATIDDKPANILRANYVLRALHIPAGDHTIEFSFKPKSYYVGNKITAAATGVYIVLILAGIFIAYKKNASSTEA